MCETCMGLKENLRHWRSEQQRRLDGVGSAKRREGEVAAELVAHVEESHGNHRHTAADLRREGW